MAKANVLDLERSGETFVPEACVGWLVEWSADRGAVVDFPGNASGPIHARTTVVLDDEVAARAVGERQSVLLVFERGRPDLPILIGLVQPVGAPAATAVSPPREAVIDGRRVVLSADDEIVLRCGEASITLRRNGRVVIRGAFVETRASGVNRIKGGSVLIN
jgi:hypothetical protein